MPKITIRGIASKKTYGPFSFELNTQNLLDFLIEKNLPIAYSCYGEGICEKCSVEIKKKDVLSCQVLMKDLDEDDIMIAVNYL